MYATVRILVMCSRCAFLALWFFSKCTNRISHFRHLPTYLIDHWWYFAFFVNILKRKNSNFLCYMTWLNVHLLIHVFAVTNYWLSRNDFQLLELNLRWEFCKNFAIRSKEILSSWHFLDCDNLKWPFISLRMINILSRNCPNCTVISMCWTFVPTCT